MYYGQAGSPILYPISSSFFLLKKLCRYLFLSLSCAVAVWLLGWLLPPQNWALFPPLALIAVLANEFSSLLSHWDGGCPDLEQENYENAPVVWRWRLALKPLLACLVWPCLVLLTAGCGLLSLTPSGGWAPHLPLLPDRVTMITAALLILYGWFLAFERYFAAWGQGKLAWSLSNGNISCSSLSLIFAFFCAIQPIVLDPDRLLKLLPSSVQPSAQTSIQQFAPYLYPVTLLSITVLLFFRSCSKRSALSRELEEAGQILAEGGALFLFADGTLNGLFLPPPWFPWPGR